MSPGWVGFLVGAFMGGTLGVLIMALFATGGRRATPELPPPRSSRDDARVTAHICSPRALLYADDGYLMVREPGKLWEAVPLYETRLDHDGSVS